MILQQIKQQIQSSHSFLVVAHENPDGDAIGSTLGLALALLDAGKDVVAYNVSGMPDIMGFIPGSNILQTVLPAETCFDVAFVLDSGDMKRAGANIPALCKTVINVDHHPFSDFGDICYLDTTACATAVMIYRILQYCDMPLSPDVARNLYLGILSDTGSFRYSSANKEAFEVAGKLVACGVDPWEMASCLYESYPPERMRLLAEVLPTMKISACGRYASVSMTNNALAAAGATHEHADGFVNYPRAIRGVEVALFFNQVDENTYKVSFRSRGTIDVGALSRHFGGGGHHNAAGAKINGTLAAVQQTVFHQLDQLLA